MKRAVVNALLSARGVLREGRWLVPAVDRAFSRDADGRRAYRAWSRDERAHRRGAAASRVRRRLVALRIRLSGPRTALLVASPAPGGAVEARVTKAGGIIAFDYRDGCVTHLRAQPFAEGYEVRRGLLGRYLPNPSWTLSADRRVLSEGFGFDRRLEDLDFDSRVVIAQRLIQCCVSLVQDPALGVDERAEPPDAEFPVQLHQLDGWAESLEWWHRHGGRVAQVLAHADLTPENILVDASLNWQVIDFEDAAPRPFFFDALSPIVRDHELVPELTDGRLNADWRDLCVAAGCGTLGARPLLAARVTAVIAALAHARDHAGRVDYTIRRLWVQDAV